LLWGLLSGKGSSQRDSDKVTDSQSSVIDIYFLCLNFRKVGNGLFKFIASFNLQRFLRSSTLPRYYPFGLSKSRNNSSLINPQHRANQPALPIRLVYSPEGRGIGNLSWPLSGWIQYDYKQTKGKQASGQNPYVLSTSWLFRRKTHQIRGSNTARPQHVCHKHTICWLADDTTTPSSLAEER
jgi:hypothetical protein